MKSLSELAEQDHRHRAIEFTQLAQLLLKANGSLFEASDLAERSKGVPDRVKRILKAATASGTLDDPSTSALVDLGIVSSGFVASLRNIGFFDAVLQDAVRVPLQQPGLRITSTALVGDEVSESSASPVHRLEFEGLSLTKRKATAIIAVSEQLLEYAGTGANALLSTELRNGVVAATDLSFIDAITSGLSPVAAVGSGASGLLASLEAAAGQMSLGSASRLYVAVSPTVAQKWFFMSTTTGARAFPDLGLAGGRIGDITVVASDQAPAGSPTAAVVVDASGVGANTEVVTLDASRHAALQMDTTPGMHAGGAGSPTAPSEAPVVSMWQSNSRALMARRYFGYRVLRTSAVQLIEGL